MKPWLGVNFKVEKKRMNGIVKSLLLLLTDTNESQNLTPMCRVELGRVVRRQLRRDYESNLESLREALGLPKKVRVSRPRKPKIDPRYIHEFFSVEEMKEIEKGAGKIDIIKRVKQRTGYSLMESKQRCDTHYNNARVQVGLPFHRDI